LQVIAKTGKTLANAATKACDADAENEAQLWSFLRA
jgi:hypothetical protein